MTKNLHNSRTVLSKYRWQVGESSDAVSHIHDGACYHPMIKLIGFKNTAKLVKINELYSVILIKNTLSKINVLFINIITLYTLCNES